MKKVSLILIGGLILSITLVGCGTKTSINTGNSKNINTNENVASNNIKYSQQSNTVNDKSKINSSEISENNQKVAAQGVFNQSIITTPKDLFSYVTRTKDELLQKLGNDYQMVELPQEGVPRGYYYKDLGVTFAFNDTDFDKDYDTKNNKNTFNKVGYILCDQKRVNINGATAGMKFEQIQEKLGKGIYKEITAPDGTYKVYEIRYKIANSTGEVYFSSDSKDGASYEMVIYNNIF